MPYGQEQAKHEKQRGYCTATAAAGAFIDPDLDRAHRG